MELGRNIADWIALVLIAMVIYILVRPRSKAAELVKAFTGMVVVMLRRATDIAN